MKKIVLVLLLMNVLQMDAQTGNWLWARQATGSGLQEGTSCATDAFGNVYTTGFFDSTTTFGSFTLTSSGNNDIFIVKYSATGTVLWAKSAGGVGDDKAFSVATDVSGNVCVTGNFKSPTMVFGTYTLTNVSAYNMFIVKYSATGTVLWAKSAGVSGGNNEATSVATDVYSNIYVTGDFNSATLVFGTTTLINAGDFDMYIVKYSSSGIVLWAKSAGGSSFEMGTSIATDVLGNVCVAGWFTSATLIFGTNTLTNGVTDDMFIVKYDSSGTVVFAKNGGSALNVGNAVTTDNSGNIYVTGYFESTALVLGSYTLTCAGSYDMFIVKYSPTGLVLWAKSGGGNDVDKGWAVASDASGVYVTGGFGSSSSSSFILGSDTLLSSTTDAMFIIKFDSTGNVICISSLASGGDDWSGVATDGAGNAYIAGDSEVNPFVVGTDTLSVQSSAEYFFITKYRCPTTLAISEIPNPESLTLYPNPATTSFTIESTNKIQSIKVINVIGEDIITNYELGITNAVSIDVSGIAKGIYFVQITVDSAGSPTKKVVNKKIVVQ